MNSKLNIKTDTIKFGIGLLFSQILSGKCYNFSIIIYTLIGYACFQLLIYQQENDNNIKINHENRVQVDEILKFSTMILISKLLLNGDTFSKELIIENANIILSFITYNKIISKYITRKFIKKKMTFKDVMIVSDLIKYSFVFLFSNILNKIAGHDTMKMKYFKITFGYIYGLILYDYLLS